MKNDEHTFKKSGEKIQHKISAPKPHFCISNNKKIIKHIGIQFLAWCKRSLLT